ncbi:MAG: protein kinase [Kofleriaceae bacterium]
MDPTERAPGRAAPSAPPPAWRDAVAGCLGEGGFATVWEVHPASRPPYALKIAKAATELATRRMVREISAMAAIGAPWVPGLIEHGIDADGHAWLAMELIRGVSLGDLIATEAPTEQLRATLRGLLDAVVHMHAARVIHRDLKPDNVIVGADDRVTILDLGMARRAGVDADDPFAASIAGSAEYMAPEQLDSGKVSDRADVYSLGVIAYEMCALRPPFVGSAVEVGRGHGAMRPPRLVDAPPEFEALYNEALRKDPTQRPSAAELLQRLDSTASSDVGAVRRRVTVPMTFVRDRPQPVVVMWAELARLDRNVLAMFGAHKLRIASQRGRRVLAVLLASDHPTPSSEALSVGEALIDLGAKVVLHLADCVVSGERVSGPALAAPETWLPRGAWSGLRLSAEFAATVDRPVAAASDGAAGFLMLAEAPAGVVVGRDGILQELHDAIAIHESGPGLVLVTGAVGVGKSTVAEALRHRLAEGGAQVHMAAVPPPGYGRSAGGAQIFSPFLADWLERPLMPDLADATRALAKDRPLVLVLDDVDLAERELLDALEYMTLGGGDRCALWVVCFASDLLLSRRPDFGARARRVRRLSLPGLDEEAAVALASKWLAPVDYLPVASLRPLLTVADGNPLHIVSLCRELHERKAIQRRADGGYFLDTSSLDQLPTLALAPWMATRQLAGLPEETVALARVCAVLGETFERVELEAVVEQLDESAGGRIDIDLAIGAAELGAAGLLEEDGPRLRFVNGLVCEGICAMLEHQEREAVHRLALAYWKHARAAGNADLTAVQRIARHARAVGDRETAGRTCAELARVADRAHRYVESEQQWSAALQHLAGEAERAEALVGRARARYRQQRTADAIADARQAVELAEALGDRDLLVDALLEESTALDWAEDFETSAARAATARRWASGLDPVRQNRLALAEARVIWRRQPADAADALNAVVERADELGDHETTVIAAMLSGHAFLMRGADVDHATEVYARGELACRRNGDQFHLAALLVNRIGLWSTSGDLDRGMTDLREAVLLAREHGQSVIERAGAYNLAELLLWRDQLDESMQWASRSLNLQERSGNRAAAPELLLTLRVAAAQGDRAQVSAGLAVLPAELSPVCECFRAALTTWLHPDGEAWKAVIQRAEQHLEHEQVVELLVLALSTGVLDAETSRRFESHARTRPGARRDE